MHEDVIGNFIDRPLYCLEMFPPIPINGGEDRIDNLVHRMFLFIGIRKNEDRDVLSWPELGFQNIQRAIVSAPNLSL